jgi:CBS domain-containing protein
MCVEVAAEPSEADGRGTGEGLRDDRSRREVPPPSRAQLTDGHPVAGDEVTLAPFEPSHDRSAAVAQLPLRQDDLGIPRSEVPSRVSRSVTHDASVARRATPPLWMTGDASAHVPGTARAPEDPAVVRSMTCANGANSVTTTRPNQRLGEVLEVMREKDFSAVPVVDEDDRFIALLTNDDIVHWLADHLSEHGIVEEVPVADVMHAGGPDFTFVARDMPQRDARRLFQRSADEQGAPLMAMMVTMTGKPHEPLLGILTPWDLPQLTPAPPLNLALAESSEESVAPA